MVFCLVKSIAFDWHVFFSDKKKTWNANPVCARQHYTLNPIILADYWLDSVCSLCRWSRLTLSLPCLVRLHIYIINYITLLLIIFYTSSRSSSRILYAHTQKYTITRESPKTHDKHIFSEKNMYKPYTRLKDKKRKYKTINKKITKIKLKYLEKTSFRAHDMNIFRDENKTSRTNIAPTRTYTQTQTFSHTQSSRPRITSYRKKFLLFSLVLIFLFFFFLVSFQQTYLSWSSSFFSLVTFYSREIFAVTYSDLTFNPYSSDIFSWFQLILLLQAISFARSWSPFIMPCSSATTETRSLTLYSISKHLFKIIFH